MARIPTYALYGETSGAPLRDWLHWETIQSRSRLHGYTIASHRHEQFFQVLSLSGGTGEVELGGVRQALPVPSLVLIPPTVVHGYRFSEDVDGLIVTLPEADVRQGGFVTREPQVIAGDLGEATSILANMLLEADRPRAEHDRAMRAHVTLLSVALLRLSRSTSNEMAASDPARRHFEAFRVLVNENYRRTRRLGDYARSVGISTTHLSRVCREIAGRPPLALIEERIATEARRMLRFSDLSIRQIGEQLGYEDPAYFTRFLTRVLGQSPSAFRRRKPD